MPTPGDRPARLGGNAQLTETSTIRRSRGKATFDRRAGGAPGSDAGTYLP